ncbi:hypothetical protein ACOBR2_02300 [Telmatobacter bradus]|uniref:hypothetical protein n=1 Tax=Telmatobacter bradus TaxID=474953 RepID=UPI003B433691
MNTNPSANGKAGSGETEFSGANGSAARSSGFFVVLPGFCRVFNFHIAKFFGIKDFATLQAFDKLTVSVPGNDSNLRVSAGVGHRDRFE